MRDVHVVPRGKLREELARATAEHPVRIGAYDVTGLLGKGGMGEVYEAVQREHGIRVALKTLANVEPERLLRFKAEFRSVAGVSHPNLVPLYELGCEDDLWFFTMERVTGSDFLSAVRGARASVSTVSETAWVGTTWTTVPDASEQRPSKSRRGMGQGAASLPPSIPRLREVLLQLVRGVHALHEAGFVHADLKPSNVLVEPEGRVVVLDFGLVQPIPRAAGEAFAPEGPRSRSRSLLGTPAWMAPEQFVGEVLEASDWYAVGLMLYEALTGVSAFVQSEAVATWYARVHLAPQPPQELLRDVPPDLAALAVALLEPNPSDRPSGAAVLELLAMDATARANAVSQLVRTGFVGRSREREALREAFERSRAGAASLVHVVGPSGVGKSALLGSFADTCREAGALVLTGRCYERETVPYKAFDGIVDDLAVKLRERSDGEVALDLPPHPSDLTRVFPVLATVPAIRARLDPAQGEEALLPVRDLRRRAMDALRELFEKLAARQPIVLRIEDLQWADVDSMALLQRVLDAAIPRLLVAASFRPEEASRSAALAPHLERLEVVGGPFELVTVQVGALPRAEAEALAAATLRALRVPPGDLAPRIAEEAGGVPYFVEELAHYVARQAERPERPPPSMQEVTLEAVLARRVQELPDTERALVETLSVANSPIPIPVWFSVAGVQPGALRALWALRGSHFVRSAGARGDDRIELHHDRMRESVLRYMSEAQIVDVHLRLGRALAPGEDATTSPWLFDAVRHYGAAAARLQGDERLAAAHLHLLAGRAARSTAAFSLAFDCLRGGVALLPEDAWETRYDLALELHGAAAEAAYLSATWGAVDALVGTVEQRARGVLDQLVAREVRIDACIARREYAAALDAALDVLGTLGVALPANPDDAAVGAAVGEAMESLAKVGHEGLLALPLADDPRAMASMRLLGRISSAAYFARPALLPVIACRLVAISVDRGLGSATPYALAVYGIVLNALGMLREAHAWGTVAEKLLDRVPDRSHEARTRHVVNDLVCVFTVPLATTLEPLRAVVEVGKETGDLEYAAYAAHAYVHNAFYAGRPLAALEDEAVLLGGFMRGNEQMNALHVHAPFEQALRCFLGRTPDPARLDGEGFREGDALAAAIEDGSRSAQCIVRMLMGIVRYHFGDAADASAHLEAARPFLDGVTSTWHVPIFHQYAALARLAAGDAVDAAGDAPVDESLAVLRRFAEHGPENFAHRVILVEAERARARGDLATAKASFARAADAAAAGGFANDEGLAFELLARCCAGAQDADEASRYAEAARQAYARWGAAAKIARLATTR